MSKNMALVNINESKKCQRKDRMSSTELDSQIIILFSNSFKYNLLTNEFKSHHCYLIPIPLLAILIRNPQH